ncbi:MAG TPA: hypothetical protein VF921_06545, partial [Vicinamibacterales bacterium]
MTGRVTDNVRSLCTVGPHPITAGYSGDTYSTPSRSAALTQTVDKADQILMFDPIADKRFGDPDFTINAGSLGAGYDARVTGERRHEGTRLDPFSDAVFAFALTLPVVSREAPRSDRELMALARGFLPFACSFALRVW